MPTYREYIADIKKRVHEATPEQVEDLIRSGDVQLGDVREKDEWNAGHIVGAVHVPKSYVEQWAEDRLPDKEKTTILYCAAGVRSAMAADTLQKLGYQNVISMAGGFNRWKDSGKPWTTPASLTPEQAQRYSRHRSSSERVAWDRPRRYTSPLRASVPLASSTPMWSISPTCSGRSFTTPIASASRRSPRRSRRSRP